MFSMVISVKQQPPHTAWPRLPPPLAGWPRKWDRLVWLNYRSLAPGTLDAGSVVFLSGLRGRQGERGEYAVMGDCAGRPVRGPIGADALPV